jgi:L-iditol 2-dehydrogenase
VRAAVLVRPGRIELQERPRPEPGPGEVLVQVTAVGICGSDVHYWERGAIGPFVVRAPLVLGHEAAGTVVAAGPGAAGGPRPGDRVALEPGIPCGRCPACRSGRYNLCPDVAFLATPPQDGALAEFVAHRADFCHVLPPGVDDEAGALLEPLSVGVHAARRGGVGLGSRVLVTGLGPIGLMAVLAARAAGAAAVWGSDPVEFRRAAAGSLGAAAWDPAAAGAVDVAVECSGAQAALDLCCRAVGPGGRVVVVGMGEPRASLPIVELQTREVDVVPVFRYCHTYPAALALVAAGTAPVGKLITDRLPMSEVGRAFERARSAAPGTIKVMVDPRA